MQTLLLFSILASFLAPNSLISPVINAEPAEAATVSQSVEVWVTAYTSTPEETDDTPFITASGKEVRDGILAANFLPLGTKVKIPELFGDKIFTVEDRMHKRKTGFVDVWMSSRTEAIKFGKNRTQIIVLN